MNFTTVLARSSSSILKHLSKKTVESDSVLLFALSANAANLEAITSRLSQLASQTVGCLSSPHPNAPESVICSMATFPARDCISFRSEISGRAPIQVGKTRYREKSDESFELPDFSTKGDSFWESETNVKLPPALLGHEREIDSLIFFSDHAPEGLFKSFTATPQATKLGLVASSTPFITGRPFSLFRDNGVYSSGAVGLALRNQTSQRSSVSFPGLVPMSKPVKVSRSESNLIHELNHSNPSKMLVEAIAAGSTRKFPSKGEDFFLGHVGSSGAENQISRIYRILSGDPSRGSIALDAETAPRENDIVQFFRRIPVGSTETPNPQMQVSNNLSLRFVCSEEDFSPDQSNVVQEDGVRIMQNTFLAASENGFLCTGSEVSKPLWKCNVPGATGDLEWL